MSENATMTPAEMFVSMNSNENTRRAYRNDIRKWNQFLASRNHEETTETAIAFKQALEDTYAPATAQRVWSTVAAFYGWMKGTGKTEETPFHGIKSPTRPSDEPPPVPSDEDIAKLLHATDDGTEYGDRGRVIISLLLNGLRAQEVCNARISDLVRDKANKQWILNVLGKGDKWRAIPLTSRATQAIFEYHINRRKTTKAEHLVTSLKFSTPMNVKAIWRNVSFFAIKAGVSHIHPHALRHHYATRLVRAGISVFTLQKLMGHARADTTQRYVALDYTDLRKAIDIDPMDDGTDHTTLFLHMKEEDFEPAPF